MAIRRYKLAIDNHPVAGYATIDDIQGSGEFFMEIGWEPQAATVSLAKQYMTPEEYIPTSDAKIYYLGQSSPGSQDYDIYNFLTSPTAATVSALTYNSIYTLNLSGDSNYIRNNSWYLNSNISLSAVDQVVFSVKDFTSKTTLLLLNDQYNVIDGHPLYAGYGIDVSVSFGLPALTKFLLYTGIDSLSEIAEMVFVDGIQIEGDIYDYDYSYHTGAYYLTIESNALYLQFITPLDPLSMAFFMVFRRQSEPEIRVRYESDPFEETGLWIVYNNLPKGTLRFNYYVR